MLECGPDKTGRDKSLREGVVPVEEITMQRRELARWHLHLSERVLRLVNLLLQPDFAVRNPTAPLEVEYVVDSLQEHRNALQSVRDFTGNRRQVDAADLLKVR